jgi:tetratricopeptide (TPR) repeat protein
MPEAVGTSYRRRVFLFLVLTRLAGWVLAWGMSLASIGAAARVMRFHPTTLDGILAVAWEGKRPAERTLRKRPEPKNARHRAARELADQGILRERGVAELRRLLRETPDEVDYNLDLAEELFKLKQYREAGKFFERTTRVAPEDGYAFARLAEVQIRLGDKVQGLTNRSKARRMGQDVRKVDRHLFELYRREGHLRQAIKFGRQADPEEKDAEIQFGLARIFLEQAKSKVGGMKKAAGKILSLFGSSNYGLDPESVQQARRHIETCLEIEDTHSGCLALRRSLGDP